MGTPTFYEGKWERFPPVASVEVGQGNFGLSRWWQLKYLFFSPGSLEKRSNLTRIFQTGWFNHQLVQYVAFVYVQCITLSNV